MQLHSNYFTRSGFEEAFTHLKVKQNKTALRDRTKKKKRKTKASIFSQEHSTQANTRSEIEYISNGVDVNEVAKMIATRCDAAVSILDPSSEFIVFFLCITLDRENNNIKQLFLPMILLNKRHPSLLSFLFLVLRMLLNLRPTVMIIKAIIKCLSQSACIYTYLDLHRCFIGPIH